MALYQLLTFCCCILHAGKLLAFKEMFSRLGKKWHPVVAWVCCLYLCCLYLPMLPENSWETTQFLLAGCPPASSAATSAPPPRFPACFSLELLQVLSPTPKNRRESKNIVEEYRRLIVPREQSPVPHFPWKHQHHLKQTQVIVSPRQSLCCTSCVALLCSSCCLPWRSRSSLLSLNRESKAGATPRTKDAFK